MNRSRGIVYVATGQRYRLEAIRSAQSAKMLMPEIPIALFTDRAILNETAFDYISIIKEPAYSYQDKILPLQSSPFSKTLFVDTDTYFLGRIDELFDLLDVFDLACCHAPFRFTPAMASGECAIPQCFVEVNTGVMVYNSSESIRSLFVKWNSIYLEQLNRLAPPLPDQPALRIALYQNPVRLYILPPEYNMRTPFPMYKGQGIAGKILHGTGATLNAAISKVSASGSDFGLYNCSRSSFMKCFADRIFALFTKSLNKAWNSLADRR